MNNNTKLFGVLVAALFAFGALGGANAQNGFSTFVELGDWEYDIANDNIETYCKLNNGTGATDCGIFSTGDDFTDGDLYLGPIGSPAEIEVQEGFLRLFNENGFDAGTIVQDEDADEGAAITLDDDAHIRYIRSVNETGPDELQNAELAAFFVSDNGLVDDDDLSFTDGERIDNHDLEGAALVDPSWDILFADLDGKGDHDADEPLFADVDGGTSLISEGDLILNGQGFFSLVEADGPFVANAGVINIFDYADTVANGSGYFNDEYFLAILDEPTDLDENGYRGEDILLVRETDDANFPGRVGGDSFVLLGPRQGELIDDDHVFYQEEFADLTADNDDDVVICALVGDADDDAVDSSARVFFHFGDADCDADADEGDADLTNNEVLSSDADGELTDFVDTTANHTFNDTAWFVIDLNDNDEINAGEPILFDADGSDDVSLLDFVISEDGAFLVGPGYQHLAPMEVPLTVSEDPADASTKLQFCTYHEETEDENGDDLWLPLAVHLRTFYTHDVSGADEGTCNDEDVIDGDFVLAGSSNVGQFLTEDQVDDLQGEYAQNTDGGDQVSYDLYYDDLFPSGFGPEDIVFLVPDGNPVLDEEAFYLGGPVLGESDDYFETKVDDLDVFGNVNGDPFVLIEGDNRDGLSMADWFYLTSNAAEDIDDETLILYKGGSAIGGPGEEPETPETPEEPEVPETPETPEGPGTEEKPEPGFEVIALIAALGAALVLVRRRN